MNEPNPKHTIAVMSQLLNEANNRLFQAMIEIVRLTEELAKAKPDDAKE